MKLRHFITPLFFLSVIFASMPSFAGTLSVQGVAITPNDQTLLTTCVRRAGFFLEIGKQGYGHGLKAMGHFKNQPLYALLPTVIPNKWHLNVGKNVNGLIKYSWQGPILWNNLLEKVAVYANLAIIIDWNNNTVYVRKI
jgi:hypothetical protein